MVNFQEFKNKIQAAEGLIFHYYKHDFVITSPVETIELYYGEEAIKINFSGGNIIVWAKDDAITKVDRPSMLIVECEFCYSLQNEYGDGIGYLYKKKEGKE